MLLKEVVRDVVDLERPLKRLLMEGDAEAELELPLDMLNISINKNSSILVNIDKNKDDDYKNKYDIYMWGILYYKNNNISYISIGGLIFKIKIDLPFNVGDKIYIGLKLTS
ncbi:MAG: DNA-directed RNA polymerase [Thermoproteus sp.]